MLSSDLIYILKRHQTALQFKDRLMLDQPKGNGKNGGKSPLFRSEAVNVQSS